MGLNKLVQNPFVYEIEKNPKGIFGLVLSNGVEQNRAQESGMELSEVE